MDDLHRLQISMASPRGSGQSAGLLQQAFSDAESVGSGSRTNHSGESNNIDIRPRGSGRSRALSSSIAGSHGSMSHQTPARSYVQRSYHASHGTKLDCLQTYLSDN